MIDLLLKDGRVVDGTGQTWFRASVAVSGDTVQLIRGDSSAVEAARVIDATHAIAPHHVLHGAFVLGQILPWYPPGTIHLAVVDPGVGSNRRILVGKYAGQYVIAPDNGLMTMHTKKLTDAEMGHAAERFMDTDVQPDPLPSEQKAVVDGQVSDRPWYTPERAG